MTALHTAPTPEFSVEKKKVDHDGLEYSTYAYFFTKKNVCYSIETRRMVVSTCEIQIYRINHQNSMTMLK